MEKVNKGVHRAVTFWMFYFCWAHGLRPLNVWHQGLRGKVRGTARDHTFSCDGRVLLRHPSSEVDVAQHYIRMGCVFLMGYPSRSCLFRSGDMHQKGRCHRLDGRAVMAGFRGKGRSRMPSLCGWLPAPPSTP